MENAAPIATHARVDFVAKRSDPSRQSSQNYTAPQREPARNQKQNRPSQNDSSQMEPLEIVSGRWLVKAILLALVAAGVALYFTVCLLFYQGQWQFVFSSHPSASVHAASIASSAGLPIQEIKFDYTEEGVARLDGWWIPATSVLAQSDSSASTNTARSLVVLFYPSGRSTLPANIDVLRAFHTLGVSVFAFDYRGLGQSQRGHPSQTKAYEDGMAALRYLIGMRHIDSRRIVLYGAEAGSAVASHVAQQSPQIAGLILENPQPSFTRQVKREQRIHLLPMWLIFRQSFDISKIVPTLQMPKLVIATSAKPEYPAGAAEIYARTAPPKQKADFKVNDVKTLYAQSGWKQAIGEFLDNLNATSK